MRWKLIAPISLVSVLSLGSLSMYFTSSRLNAAEGLHYIAALNGDVLLKRRWWLGYRFANVGDVLSLSDWLRIRDPLASATVLCNDITRWQISRGDHRVSKGCNGSGLLVRDTDILHTRGVLRGYENENRPYLLSPRNTAVLPSDSLALRWHSVSGADTYEVRIQSLTQTLWATHVSEPEAIYPDLAALTPPNRYLITVTTNTGVTSPDVNAPPTLVWVIDAETVHALEADLTKLDALALDEEAKTLARAHVYRSYNLYQQGIDALETAIQTRSQTATMYQLQAELYQEIGLTRQAEIRYLNALELATAQDNLALQAELHVQLGLIARSVEDFEQAIAWLSAAEANYRALLDSTQPEVQAQLTDLQKLIQDSQDRRSEV